MTTGEKPASGQSIDQILAQPLSGLRIAVADRFQKEGVSLEDVQRIAQQLEQPTVIHDPEELGAVKKEFANVQAALRTGKAPQAPNLEYPATQLLWGAALAHAISHPETPANWLPLNRGSSFTKSALWRQLTNTPYMKDELREHAFHISDSIRNPHAKIRWGAPPDGYPGVGFFYNPDDNVVNLDLLWSLIDGVEHSRAANLHEIGHSQLTAKFTPKMQAVRTEMESLIKQKEQQGKLTPKEYKRLNLLSLEWHLRHRVFDEAENNVVDRYAANQSQRMAQDYSYSRNNVETIMCGAGKQVLEARSAAAQSNPLPEEPNAQQKFDNLCRTLRMSFFRNNGLFEDTDKGWQEVGVNRSWIQGTPKKRMSSPASLTPEQSFAELMELCGGVKGLENLQPSVRDRMFGKGGFAKKVEEFSDRRNAIIDDVFERYAAPLMREMLKEADQQLDQQMQNQAGQDGDSDQNDQQQGQQQGQQGQGEGKGDQQDKDKKDQQQGKGQGQSGEDSQDKDGEKQEGQGATGKDKNDGEKDKKASQDKGDQSGSESGQEKGDGDQQGDGGQPGGKEKGKGEQPGDESGQDGQQAGEQGSDSSRQGKPGGQGQPGGNQPGAEGQPQKSGGEQPQNVTAQAQNYMPGQSGQRGKKPEKVTVEGFGKLPDIELPPATPKEMDYGIAETKGEEQAREGKASTPTSTKPREGANELNPRDKETEDKTVEQLLEERGEVAGGMADRDYGGKVTSAPRTSTIMPTQTYDITTKIEPGEITVYHKRAAELEAPIRRVSELFKRIRQKQSSQAIKPSPTRTIMPEDGELERFDSVSHRDMMIKRLSGQEIQEEDLHRFRQDQNRQNPPVPHLVLMIDDSGSSYHNVGSSKALRLETARDTAIVMNEAAKRAGWTTSIYAVGSANPHQLKGVKDNDTQAAKAFSGKIFTKTDRLRNGEDGGCRNEGCPNCKIPQEKLAPAVKLAASELSEQPAHPEALAGDAMVIYIGDGEINDMNAAKINFEKLFESSRKVTVDGVVINNTTTPFDGFAEKAAARDRKQMIGIAHPKDTDEIEPELVKLLTARLQKTHEEQPITFAEHQRTLRQATRTM